MTLRMLLLICIATLFVSCSSSGKVTGNSTRPSLIFGNGGGFTGIYTIYKLNDDGRVYSVLPDSTQQRINHINKKKTRALFSQADQLKMTEPAFNHPGNITWFIRYKKGNELVEFKWGDSKVPVPDEIKNLYNQLIITVN